MAVSTIIGAVLLLIVSDYVILGQRRLGWLTSAKTTIYKPEFIDEFNVELIQTDNSTFISVSMNVTQTLPTDILVLWNITYGHGSYWWIIQSLCNWLEHTEVAPYLRAVILPKDRFPKKCPMIAGNWSVVKWEPLWQFVSTDSLPDGPFKIISRIYREMKRGWAQIQFEGVLSETLP